MEQALLHGGSLGDKEYLELCTCQPQFRTQSTAMDPTGSTPHRPSNDRWGPLGQPTPELLPGASEPHGQWGHPTSPRGRATGLRRWGSIGLLLAFVFGKLKWVLAALKFLKFGSLITMVLSVAVYAQYFGWPFSVGFVLLILLHELGHLVAMRQQGIPAGAPVFIPFVGAVIAMKGRPRDAYVEAIVGIGGPVLGGLAAGLCLVVAYATGSLFFYALAATGFLINLFNMIPISPLDGGRVAGAVSRQFWFVGYLIGIGVFLITMSPIVALILIVGLVTIYRGWKRPTPGYYAIPQWKRVSVGAGYFGVLAILALGMWLSEGPLGQLSSGQLSALVSGALLLPASEVLSGLRQYRS